MERDKIQTEVRNILEKVLPSTFNIMVNQGKDIFGGYYLKIGASPSTYEISQVRGQYPQVVSLRLDFETLELESQIFGGMGGNRFYRDIRPDLNPKEKYLAQSSVKVPFRKPKKELKAVYGAIQRFFERYLELLKEWKDDLKYKEHGDYSFLDNN